MSCSRKLVAFCCFLESLGGVIEESSSVNRTVIRKGCKTQHTEPQKKVKNTYFIVRLYFHVLSDLRDIDMPSTTWSVFCR